MKNKKPKPRFNLHDIVRINCPFKRKAHRRLSVIKKKYWFVGSWAYWCEGNTGAGMWSEDFLVLHRARHATKVKPQGVVWGER